MRLNSTFFRNPIKTSSDEASAIHIKEAEKSVAVPRFLVITLNTVVYLFFMDKAGTFPILAYFIMAISMSYSFLVIVYKPYERFKILLTSYYTTITDGLLIALWIIATGGYDSPFYVLWYMSIVAISFRYYIKPTAIIATVYSLLYLTIIYFDVSLMVHLVDIIVRIGYIYIVGMFSGLLSTSAIKQISEKIEIRESEKKAQATKSKLNKLLFGLKKEIVQRESTQQALKRKTKELKTAKEKAEESEKIKGQFLANMSHEIRTPMNVILGMLGLLLKAPHNKEQKELLNSIKASSDNLLVIINDILDFSKIEHGGFAFDMKPFNIHDLINEVSKSIKAKYEHANLKIITSIDKNIPQVIIGDPVRLNQILLNLLSNAGKFTDEGEIRTQVWLKKESNNKVELIFTISDSGVGMDKNVSEKIFERFTQGSDNITKKAEGTGLGLAIVKNLIDQQGGKISVKSKVGEGSIFKFNLPFQRSIDEKQENENTPDTEVATERDLSGLKILLVEDHELNRLFIKKLFSTWKIEHYGTATNGKEAIEMVQEQSYDVVLMDIQMPVMNGYDATTYIRTKLSPPYSEVYIISMTAYATSKEWQRCFDVGMNDYVAKPINVDKLYQKLAELMKSKTKKKTKKSKLKKKEEEKNSIPTASADLSYLKQICNNDMEFINKMVNKFIKETPEELEKLKNHIQSEEWDRVRAIAHKLRNTIDFMGIHELKGTVSTIEEYAIEEKQLGKIPMLGDEVFNACNKVINDLREEYNEVGME